MPKTKKTKAPLETKAEAGYWKELTRENVEVTVRLRDGERFTGRLMFAAEDAVGVEIAGGQTRLAPLEEVAYVEESTPAS
jgi:repressor of nif and glnA expression